MRWSNRLRRWGVWLRTPEGGGPPARPALIGLVIALALMGGALAVLPMSKPQPHLTPLSPELRESIAQRAAARKARAKLRRIVNGRVQPRKVRVPHAAGGRYAVAPGTSHAPRGAKGRVIRYMVEVERGLPFGVRAFAAAVHRTLNDPRGWGHGGRLRFVRVDRPPVRLRVALASPALTDRQCVPLRTNGVLSCWNGRRSIVNALRWGQGAATYGGDLASYREYMINHEVGLALGHPRRSCTAPGRPAPVMARQTISLAGCLPNPWPHPGAAPASGGQQRPEPAGGHGSAR
ncbi:hypothetical protein HNP84_004019 [Thermocatellispora tengchongensis]|uniref:DUF3152 domain-containing protein n=1 Tax=Thermocatellispora tengchongensis TaxID=1073253 RepID=A0A840PAR4_9ACTN|nr:DUF3152 domain-containing protein [Thermocatellispora tengchongensis]MBB5134287.1 hypothetical protein [Thermocatellispora tengchongensis]